MNKVNKYALKSQKSLETHKEKVNKDTGPIFKIFMEEFKILRRMIHSSIAEEVYYTIYKNYNTKNRILTPMILMCQ